MYSSINQNALHQHHSQQTGIPGQHFQGRSPATTHANSVLSNNYNVLNSYSNYFPASGNSHHGGSHVFHVQQEIDQSAINEILDDPKKPKKWQQKALNKCGKVDSQQAR